MMHHDLIQVYEGGEGIRDEGLLDAALNAPFQTFDSQPLFPSIQQKAARLCYGLVMNHPFIDGNKRIGAHTMLTFLAINGILLCYAQRELYEIILGVAAGEVPCDVLLQWIVDHEE